MLKEFLLKTIIFGLKRIGSSSHVKDVGRKQEEVYVIIVEVVGVNLAEEMLTGRTSVCIAGEGDEDDEDEGS